MSAYQVREHSKNKPDHWKKKKENQKESESKTNQTIGGVENVMQDRRSERKGCKKNNIRAEEEQIHACCGQNNTKTAAVARTK